MFCPKCKAEYVKGITVCADCGVRLVGKLSLKKKKKTKRKRPKQHPKYVELLITFNKGEIAFIRSILDTTEIDYYFKGENFQMVHIFPDPARLMVRESQIEMARKLLKDLDFKFSAIPAVDEK